MPNLIIPGAFGSVDLNDYNTVVAIGDSRVEQIHSDANKLNKAAWNHFTMGNALAGNRALLVKNLGVGGDRTDQALARLHEAATSGAGWLYIHCGVNDIAQNYPTANTSGVTAFTNIKTMVQTAAGWGMRSIVALEPGAANLSAAQIVQVMELNERLRWFAETSSSNVILFDLPAALYDHTSADTAAIHLNGMQDGVHEANLGGYLGGKAFAALLTSIMPPRGHGAHSSIDIPGTSNYALLNNPIMANTSGGVKQTGVTGTLAGLWSAVCTGGTTAVASVGTTSDGRKEQVLACTFGSAGEEVLFTQDVPNSLWNAGDILQAEAEVAVDAGAVNFAGAYLYVQCYPDSSPITTMDCFPDPGHGATSNEAYTLKLVTEKLVVPPLSVKNWTTVHVRAAAAGAGSATVRIRSLQLRKRYS